MGFAPFNLGSQRVGQAEHIDEGATRMLEWWGCSSGMSARVFVVLQGGWSCRRRGGTVNREGGMGDAIGGAVGAF